MVESVEGIQAGTVYTWGRNNDGLLGHEAESKEVNKHLPGKVRGLKNIVKVASYMNYFLAVSKEGQLFGWGSNTRNRIGMAGPTEGVVRPTLIPIVAKILKVSCGTWHSLALSDAGIVFSAGDGKKGELGRDGGSGFEKVHFDQQIDHICAGF